MSLRRSFYYLGHSSPFIAKRDKNTILYLVKDLISLNLIEKNDVIEGLLILLKLTLPNNMRGRTVVSKVLQNIGPFRKGMFKELWKMPNVVLRYGSFNSVKRAGELVQQ